MGLYSSFIIGRKFSPALTIGTHHTLARQTTRLSGFFKKGRSPDGKGVHLRALRFSIPAAPIHAILPVRTGEAPGDAWVC